MADRQAPEADEHLRARRQSWALEGYHIGSHPGAGGLWIESDHVDQLLAILAEWQELRDEDGAGGDHG